MSVENSGGNTDYYRVTIHTPNQAEAPYIAECGDIIEALGMDFNEGTAFKSLWRRAAARTLGKHKEGNDNPIRDAEKVVFYSGRSLTILKRNEGSAK